MLILVFNRGAAERRLRPFTVEMRLVGGLGWLSKGHIVTQLGPSQDLPFALPCPDSWSPSSVCVGLLAIVAGGW